MDFKKVTIVILLLQLVVAGSFLQKKPQELAKEQLLEGSEGSSFSPFKIFHKKHKKHVKSTPVQCDASLFQKLIPNYIVETHKVETEDGYILTLFNVKLTQKQNKEKNLPNAKPPVFLQHGINDDGHCFFLTGEKLSLGSILLNNGFDVWIGNSRGCKYSRKHKTLSVDSKEFWKFSFQQMGMYDVPANLQYIKSQTGADKIPYIGHSQGTSQMFAALGDPAIRDKVVPHLKVFYALAPVVFLKNNRIPLFNLGKLLEHIAEEAASVLNVNYIEAGTCDWDQAKIDHWNADCQKNFWKCKWSYELSDEYPDVENFAAYGFDKMLSPSGISVDSVAHYGQLLKGKKSDAIFRRFDYGEKGNMKAYGQKTPPPYDLSLIKEKVRLWYGTGDKLADTKDVHILNGKLVNADVSMNELKKWGHVTFNLGKHSDIPYQKLADELKAEFDMM